MSQAPVVAVATSGGRDSTALLHCTVRQAQPLGLRVLALHVHHGLQPQADAWLSQVRRQARRWGAAFDSRRLAGAPAAGESVEAWARRGRYAALAEMAIAAGCPLVLLAHHRRDQAETVLLQALRGGGPAGLSAMPAQAERAGLVWARPWLAQPRAAIEAYVRQHRLAYVDDASNASERLARNRLRLQVWPALSAAFPEAEVALAQVARHAQDAAAVLAECAEADLRRLRQPDGSLDAAGSLALSAPRRRALLRHWLQQVLPSPVPESLVARLALELGAPLAAAASGPGRLRPTGRWPAGAGEVRLYRGALRWAGGAEAARPLGANLVLDLSCPGRHPVPAWAGSWLVRPVPQGGVAIERLRRVQLRARRGGEQYQASTGGVPRSLKKQFQAAGVPAWARQAPLLFTADGRLLCVPALGIDARQQAEPGQPQCLPEWLPDEPAT
jgi:tRNA(Ile)-lysidine synthase